MNHLSINSHGNLGNFEHFHMSSHVSQSYTIFQLIFMNSTSNLQLFCNTNQRVNIEMFYNYSNLKTELTFSHYDMDKLASDDQLIKKLKEKVEGRCLPDYGYLIQVIQPNLIRFSVPHVQNHGCVVTATFSAITFKPEKNDVIDIIVCEISEEFIKGKIGHAEVMIPRSKMPQNGCEYRSNENVYIFRDEGTNEELKIDKESKVRCRCFQIKTELNFQMKIIAHIDENLITSMQSA